MDMCCYNQNYLACAGQRLILNNKYYTAELTVVSIEAREVSESASRQGALPDGVILLFRGGAQSAASEAETRRASTVGHDADVQLCVTDLGFPDSGESWTARVVLPFPRLSSRDTHSTHRWHLHITSSGRAAA